MEIRKSPARTRAWAAGELGASFQAWTPVAVSSKATPSSGVSKLCRWTKFSQAKIIAASVASARTTAPRLTRRFCFMIRAEYTPTWQFKVQTDVHCRETARTQNCNVFLRLGDRRERQTPRLPLIEINPHASYP